MTGACGGRTHAERWEPDAATTGGVDAESAALDGGSVFVLPVASPEAATDTVIDVGPPVVCDGTFFIELTDDSGTWRASDNCMDGGPPQIKEDLCAEDYACTTIAGCAGNRFVTLVVNAFGAGVWDGYVHYGEVDAGVYSVRATIRIKTFPSDGGTVSGDYDGDPAGAAGGSAPGGRFCVVPSP